MCSTWQTWELIFVLFNRLVQSLKWRAATENSVKEHAIIRLVSISEKLKSVAGLKQSGFAFAPTGKLEQWMRSLVHLQILKCVCFSAIFTGASTKSTVSIHILKECYLYRINGKIEAQHTILISRHLVFLISSFYFLPRSSSLSPALLFFFVSFVFLVRLTNSHHRRSAMKPFTAPTLYVVPVFW